jgi:hypothetical protein
MMAALYRQFSNAYWPTRLGFPAEARQTGCGRRATMAGMKVTLSAAMRARDVSRPGPDDEAAAERAEARRAAGGAPRATGGPVSRAASGENKPPAPGARPREDGGDRDARPARKGGGSGRSRRKRR